MEIEFKIKPNGKIPKKVANLLGEYLVREKALRTAKSKDPVENFLIRSIANIIIIGGEALKFLLRFYIRFCVKVLHYSPKEIL